MNSGFNTYRILSIPKNFNGIIDLRPYVYNQITNRKITENSCFLFDGISTTQDISNSLRQYTTNTSNYKFCQLEPITEGQYKGYYPVVPNFIDVKNILGRSIPTFEIKEVKYKDLPISTQEKEFFIKKKYLSPILNNQNISKEKINQLMYKEWKGDKVTDLEKNNLIKEYESIEKQIDNFDSNKFNEEFFKAEF